MKTFILGLVVIAGLQSNAFAGTSGLVTLSAQSGAQTVSLTDLQYQPIYSQEAYQDTCSRSVFDHVETTCQTISDSVCQGGGNVCQTVSDSVCQGVGASQVCHSVPRSVCHTEPQTCTNVPRSVCTNHDIFRTEYYSCTQYRTVVSGQQLVKTYNHQITVSVDSSVPLTSGPLSIAVGATLGDVSARLTNSFAAGLLSYTVSNVSQNDTGAVVNSVENISITLALNAAQVNAVNNLALPSVDLGHNAIRFLLQNGTALLNNLKISINLVRDRAIGANTTLYNSSANSSDLGLVGQGSDLNALIPLSKLNVDSLGNSKYDLAVSIGLNTGSGTLLNASDFSAQLQKSVSVNYHRINASF
jgi:hypothetical protein